MQSYNSYLTMVNDAIDQINYPTGHASLYEPISYTLALGGKRLRPVLALMTCEALGGNASAMLDAALGVELFHNFTLMHDDVIDKAELRRGKPTVQRRWGTNVAVLSGDAMLTMATRYITKVDNKHLPAIVDLFNRTAMQIYEGQQLDMDFENRINVTEDEYIEMIRLKTSVLLGCACRMGAIMAEASEAEADAAYEMGMNLGIAFQLEDDTLDVWGNPETFGKEIGGDIMNNKVTFLLINAIARANDDDMRELRRLLSDRNPLRDVKVTGVTALYERLGLRNLCYDAIEKYNKIAIAALDRMTMPDEAHQGFVELINNLTKRDK